MVQCTTNLQAAEVFGEFHSVLDFAADAEWPRVAAAPQRRCRDDVHERADSVPQHGQRLQQHDDGEEAEEEDAERVERETFASPRPRHCQSSRVHLQREDDENKHSVEEEKGDARLVPQGEELSCDSLLPERVRLEREEELLNKLFEEIALFVRQVVDSPAT